MGRLTREQEAKLEDKLDQLATRQHQEQQGKGVKR